MAELEGQVTHAKLEGTEWIETSQAVFDYLNSKFSHRANYMLYHGVKLAVTGTTEAIQEELSRQMDERNHGKAEGTLEHCLPPKK